VQSGEWSGDRKAVLERDEHTCRRCGTTAQEAHAGLRLYPIGDIELEDGVHESAVVTVCPGCHDSLHSDPDPDLEPTPKQLFEFVRTATEREGVTVSAVAAFASLVSGLRETLEGVDTTDPDAVADIATEYRQARREVLLAIESVDADLEHLHALDPDRLEPAVADALIEFRGTSMKLQSELRGIVALGELVVTGLDRCPGCFDPLEFSNSRCAACGLSQHDIDDWRDSDGSVAFEELHGAINETLQTASDTTEALTEHTTAVATELRGETNSS